MDHDLIPEEVDDLISDIHDLIDEKDQPQEEEETQPEAEEVLPEETAEEELPAEETPSEEPEDTEEVSEAVETEESEEFHQQRWTDRQRVPKHVAKLQQNQEEAYAKWLEEQADKDDEPPVFAEEGGKGEAEISAGGKKKRTGLWLLLALVALTVVVALLTCLVVPVQPKAVSDAARSRGSSAIVLAAADDSMAYTDMIMLLSFDTRQGTISLISIPRDTPVQTDAGVVNIGSVYGRAGGGKLGLQALEQSVSQCVGFMPDGGLVITRQTMSRIMGILGKISVDVPYAVHLGDTNIEPGYRTLTAQQAYDLLRLRKEDGQLDLARMQLQQQFLGAVIDRCSSFKALIKTPDLLNAITKTSVTDLSTRNLLWLGRAAFGAGKLYSQTLPGAVEGSWYILDAGQILPLINDYCNPYISPIEAENLQITLP